MIKSAIYEQHLDLNAVIPEDSLWAIPRYYSSTGEEVNNTRRNTGITDISHRGKLRLTGKEHLRLLQGMVSNDVMKLKEGQGVYATLLTVKGKVVSDMRIYKGEDYVLIDLEPGMNTKIKEHLVKYKLSFRAEIEDLTGDYSLFHICGPQIPEFMKSMEDSNPGLYGEFEELEFAQLKMKNCDVTVHRVNRTGEPGFDIMTWNRYAGDIWKTLIRQGSNFGMLPFGLDALEILRVEAGIPVFGKDFDDSTIPIEAGLWNALSFEKGCYVGQEVIARIKWRGRVNWHLAGLVMESPDIPKSNDHVYIQEKKIGRLTSPVYSYTIEKPVSLAYLRREYIEHGTEVSVHSGDKIISAKVAGTPFYKT